MLQVDYMTAVLSCLNNGQNGLLESPTGTGVVKTGQHCIKLSIPRKNPLPPLLHLGLVGEGESRSADEGPGS